MANDCDLVQAIFTFNSEMLFFKKYFYVQSFKEIDFQRLLVVFYVMPGLEQNMCLLESVRDKSRVT